VAKASKNLAFLKRNLQSNSSSIKERAYKALVRPLLEYAAPLWDPHTKQSIKQLEMVQRRAARYVLGKYGNRSSVDQMLQTLKWPSLEDRRKIMRLCMFYKAINKEVEMPSHIEHLHLSTRPSSHIKNSKAYTVPDTPQDYIKFSFYPKTIRDWNILPENIVSAVSKDSFKNQLTKLICKKYNFFMGPR
jgi:hypothetical protein